MIPVVLLEPCHRTRRGIIRVLTRSEFRCVIAHNLDDIVRLAESEAAEILLADVDGWRHRHESCLDTIHHMVPNLSVLLLSGGHPHETPRTCRLTDCGFADGVLIKPFEDEQLIAAIALLRRSSPAPRMSLDKAATPVGRCGRVRIDAAAPPSALSAGASDTSIRAIHWNAELETGILEIDED